MLGRRRVAHLSNASGGTCNDGLDHCVGCVKCLGMFGVGSGEAGVWWELARRISAMVLRGEKEEDGEDVRN